MVGCISSGAAGLPFWWEWAPSWVFLNYFVYQLCEPLFFWGIALSDCFIILGTLFILTYMEGKLCGEHFSRVDF